GDGVLADDESRAARGAAWVPIVIGEQHPVLRDRVDVRRTAHHAVRVRADIPHSDVVAEYHEDVRLPGLVRALACLRDALGLRVLRLLDHGCTPVSVERSWGIVTARTDTRS